MKKIREYLFIVPALLVVATIITAFIGGHTDNEGLMGLSVLLGLLFIITGIVLVRWENNDKSNK